MAVKRTCQKKDLAVLLKPLTEYLLYEVSVKGASGKFELVQAPGNTVLLSGDDSPTGDGKYKRKWPQDPDEIPDGDDVTHSLGIHFIDAVRYDYTVEHRGADDSVIKVVKDCVYESQDPEDDFFEPLRVLIQKGGEM